MAKPLTIEQRELIEKYAKKGFNQAGIAKIAGVSVSTVSYELQRCNPYTAKEAHENCLKRLGDRNQRRKLKNSEREQIAELLLQGLTQAQVARKVNRSRSFISQLIKKVEGRDGLENMLTSSEDELVKQVDEHLLQRIENLEMQVEILLDTIKELKR